VLEGGGYEKSPRARGRLEDSSITSRLDYSTIL
jgi:hypothetical protein